MNSSEPLQPLTPHEEKLTAYLDGSLPPEDAAAFERQHPEALELKAQHATLSKALRQHSPAPRFGNGDFFNHQIMRQIAPSETARPKRVLLPLWRLVFASACCILAAVGVYKYFPPTTNSSGTGSSNTPSVASNKAEPKYLAQVTKVEAGDKLLRAEIRNVDGLAIVWVDGMDKMAPDYVLQ